MAWSKLKAQRKRIGAKTIEAMSKEIGNICDLYAPQKCQNHLGVWYDTAFRRASVARAQVLSNGFFALRSISRTGTASKPRSRRRLLTR